ncbi:MAG: valine--tRNA ligase [Candidatus Hadarchaeales archaeon]
MEIPKEYRPLEVEPKWQKKWEEWGIYRFRREDRHSPTYVIDTPPPYPSGEFHMGTALNWTYIDIVARYKRMRGYNVFFPQGWDCHGLPTEVQVEKIYKIRKGDLPPDKFRELCIQLTENNIAHMKEEMKSMGFSIDWSTEYRTMDPDYYGKTQLSFVLLYKKGLIYRGEHPVNWCPRCETAIADAEVEYEERETSLYYISFELDSGEKIPIATTRPEFLPACVAVAVHPEDDRYRGLPGRKIKVPPFWNEVPIIEDQEVDPEFGTGVVMICTFGDKTDVRWVKRHNLPVIRLLDERGRITEAGKKYSGMSLEECRRAVLEDLKTAGLVFKEERIRQNVGLCWRCKTPVEILSKPQWFLRVLDLNPLAIKKAKEVRWVPSHMLFRFINWAESMDWDWVISRQRIFATPIPAWYCANCGAPIVASEKQLPVIPWRDPPPVEKCPHCGGKNFKPETDVLDTWMDSSITICVHAGWPDLDPRLYPADLQPNGTDIIRTWDYYLMIRHLALLGEKPYRTVLINGMVVGEDGRKMSKSLGNYVDTSMARSKWGADALRQWAAIGASTGSDVPFSWKDVEFGHKFMQKLWNAFRFSSKFLVGAKNLNPSKLKFSPVDRWILSKYQRLVEGVTEHLENFEFCHALRKIYTFVWHDLCDNYLEAVKYRLYSKDETAEAARFTLYEIFLGITKLLAPFIPHFAEEVFQTFFSRDFPGIISVHLSEWPKAKPEFIDKESERLGEMFCAVVGALRQFKARERMPLNAAISKAIFYTSPQIAEDLEKLKSDISGTLRILELSISISSPEIEEDIERVELNIERVGPKFRSDLEILKEALEKSDPKDIYSGVMSGGVTICYKGKEFKLDPGDLKFLRTVSSADGKKVVLVEEFPITIVLPL